MSLNDAVAMVAALGAAVLAALALVGYGCRYVLLPWLRDHLVAPLLQRLDQLSQDMTELAGDTKVAAAMYDGHIERSSAEWGRLWAAIRDLQRKLRDRREDQP